MNNAYLLYHWEWGWKPPSDTIICTEEIEALEMFMALVEEEMYMTFCWMCYDKSMKNYEEEAKGLSFNDGTLWSMMEVPIIYGDTCC